MSSDNGFQPERTRLSWARTVLSLTAVTALALRITVTRGALGAFFAGLTLLGWAAAVALTRRRISMLPAPLANGRLLALAALIVVGYAVIGVALVLTGVGPTRPHGP
ncbi:MAG: DUF202 domain-containing protein [Actinobacteria bacterium]|jgi:hypothetical protein|nr:MAG: DUF202 domain-containing protein [Actinomycetota bacterium]